jgi:MFS transporter, OFA family, oxalate/formate antiporter
MTGAVRPSEIIERPGTPSTGPGEEHSTISPWWRLFGGILMTLALGTLYGWSVFVAPLEHEFGWKRAQTSTVFTLAVVMFAATLPLAGRLQDRFGPFWISLAGSLMISMSFFFFAYTSSLYYLFFFFGVLGGMGNAFGYATVVPVMAKWFPTRMGLAIGLAIAGYGGGSAIFGTLANLILFPRFGWRVSCMILSGIFLVMTMTAAFLLRNPPANLRPAAGKPVVRTTSPRRQFTPSEILRTPAFYLLWLGFGLGSTAGLMVISQLIPFATSQGISSATDRKSVV